MNVKLENFDHRNAVSEAFLDLQEPTNLLRIFTRGGDLCLVSCDLFSMLSPLVKSIVDNIPCCSTYMIFMPEVSKKSVDAVIGLVKYGFKEFIAGSSSFVNDVLETADILQIKLNNLSVIENYNYHSVERKKAIDDSNVTFDSKEQTVDQNEEDFENEANKSFTSVTSVAIEASTINNAATKVNKQPDEGKSKTRRRRRLRRRQTLPVKIEHLKEEFRNCDGTSKTPTEIETMAWFLSETGRGKDLNELTKKEMTCTDWNRGNFSVCKFGARKVHRCSKMIYHDERQSRKRMCWGFHRELDHKDDSRKITFGR